MDYLGYPSISVEKYKIWGRLYDTLVLHLCKTEAF